MNGEDGLSGNGKVPESEEETDSPPAAPTAPESEEEEEEETDSPSAAPAAPESTAPTPSERHVVARRFSPRWLFVVPVVAAAIAVPLAVASSPPARVGLMGDSLMFGAAPDVATDLRSQGIHVDASLAVDGAGLLDTNPDWLAKARTVVAEFNPNAVVVEYVGNYGVFGGPLPGVTVYSAAFYREWATKAQRLEDILTARGATVYWVLGPPIAPEVPEDGVRRLDTIYEHLRAPGGGPPALIDITPAVTGGTDRYQLYLPGPNGHPIQVHLLDGVHFTPYGYSLMARAIADGIG